MKLEVLESTDRKIELLVEETDNGVLNALRRTLMMEVPCLAIEDVTIYDNKSALFDEVIAHRLGMLPVPTQPNLFTEWDPDEGIEEDPDAQVLYTLTYEGPGTVYARDLKPATEDESQAIADPEVPIVKLGQDQRLMLEATAQLGTGSEHAKWQPVVGAGYREVPTVEVTGPLGVEGDDLRALKDKAPEDAVTFDGDEIEILDELEAHDFLYNVGTYYGVENVEFGRKEGSFFFQFETDGSLTPKQALREAIRILKGKLEAVQETASELQ